MTTPAIIQDEALFWLGQQDQEHMVFMVLGIEEAGIRNEARRLAAAYEAAAGARDMRQLLAIAQPSQALKRRALDASRAGWVGWLYPSLIDHMIYEIDHALDRMRRPLDPRAATCFWAREREGAAAVTAKLLDPVETVAAAEATRHAAALRDLAAACRRPSMGDLSRSVLGATNALARYVDRTVAARPASILNPLLVQHETREGQRSEAQLAAIAARGGR